MPHHAASHYLAARRLLYESTVSRSPAQILLKLCKARAGAMKASLLDPASPSRAELLDQIDRELRSRIAAIASELDRGHRDALASTTDPREHYRIAANALCEFGGLLDALAEGRNPPEVIHIIQRLHAAWADQQSVSHDSNQDPVEVLTRADLVPRRQSPPPPHTA